MNYIMKTLDDLHDMTKEFINILRVSAITMKNMMQHNE